MALHELRIIFRKLIERIDEYAIPELVQLIHSAYFNHHWFTADEVIRRIKAIGYYIDSPEFEVDYGKISETNRKLKIAFVSEENIPLEEFFSLLTLLILGHEVNYRGSNQPDRVLRWILEYLQHEMTFKGKVTFTDEKFFSFDKLILTARAPLPEKNRQFLHNKYPLLEIIRRQSVGVVPYNISNRQLSDLATDVFSYFGMGCGNVRKIFFPEGFDINHFIQATESWYPQMFNHHTYMNNYQYYQSVYLMNRIPHSDNGFILFKEDEQNRAPTGVVFYSFYNHEHSLREKLNSSNEIYRIYVANPQLPRELSYGKSVNQLFLPQDEIIDFAR
ncbi:MAG: hypothetical protein N2662_05225 [Bacteroidales bacterium]|nr:hypothetical protein [Bacteroidales bacterium]